MKQFALEIVAFASVALIGTPIAFLKYRDNSQKGMYPISIASLGCQVNMKPPIPGGLDLNCPILDTYSCASKGQSFVGFYPANGSYPQFVSSSSVGGGCCEMWKRYVVCTNDPTPPPSTQGDYKGRGSTKWTYVSVSQPCQYNGNDPGPP